MPDLSKYKTTTHSLDDETIELLSQIAEAEADEERPNESKALRKMIREKAQALGIQSKNKPKPPPKPK